MRTYYWRTYSFTIKRINMEKVKNITEWVRDKEAGQVKSAYLSCDRVQTLNCLTSRFNCGTGRVRRIFVHYHYCRNWEVAVLVCESLEDYYKNINNEDYYGWKDQIPNNYR